MNLLRRTIRQILFEEYKMTPQDIRTVRREFFLDKEDYSDQEVINMADFTGRGIQGPKAIQRDKQAMKDWHDLMKQNPDFVKDFTQGRVQILHSITYIGIYSKKGKMTLTPFTNWINKFGTSSRDQISCVAANAKIGEDPKLQEWDEGNIESVYKVGYGFLMKGYPAFAAKEDFMSATLSAIPQTLRDFHKNSGQVKRAQNISQSIDPTNWKGIEELILDNWKIIGIYITSDCFFSKEAENIVEDAFKLNLPVYKLDRPTGILQELS